MSFLRLKSPTSTNGSRTDTVARRALVEASRWELVPVNTIAEAIAALPPASPVSITCSPRKGLQHTLDVSTMLAAAGHDVVPHLAARLVESPEHATRLAEWTRDTGITSVFVVGGDHSEPAGPYTDGGAFLADYLAAEPGVRNVGVPGYPDGHASISDEFLSAALHHKQQLLADHGVDGWISTQMCFDARIIVEWLRAIRADGIDLPVRLGLPGAVERARLIKLGAKLGIGASLRYLRKNRQVMTKLAGPGGYDPTPLIDELAPHAEALGIEGLHVFTFNAMAATIQWRNAAQA